MKGISYKAAISCKKLKDYIEEEEADLKQMEKMAITENSKEAENEDKTER